MNKLKQYAKRVAAWCLYLLLAAWMLLERITQPVIDWVVRKLRD